MKRIAFIIPYMGKFPDYFGLWLESCKYNESIDFLIFTDDRTDYCYPPNVHVNYMTFNKLKALIQEHFDFPIKNFQEHINYVTLNLLMEKYLMNF